MNPEMEATARFVDEQLEKLKAHYLSADNPAKTREEARNALIERVAFAAAPTDQDYSNSRNEILTRQRNRGAAAPSQPDTVQAAKNELLERLASVFDRIGFNEMSAEVRADIVPAAPSEGKEK